MKFCLFSQEVCFLSEWARAAEWERRRRCGVCRRRGDACSTWTRRGAEIHRPVASTGPAQLLLVEIGFDVHRVWDSFCPCRFCGGLWLDVKRKAPWTLSDFYDGFHIQSVSAVLFIYLGCITNAITFGGLLGDATDNYQVLYPVSTNVSHERWGYLKSWYNTNI